LLPFTNCSIVTIHELFKGHASAEAGVASYWVYILKCSDGTLYTGYTTDPKRRLAEHIAGRGAKYTKGRRPVVMLYAERRWSLHDALLREIAIKKMSREAKFALGSAHERHS